MSRIVSFIFAAWVTLLGACLPGPAYAAAVAGSFSGQIFQGFDFGSAPSGFFGAGTDLTGLPISGTFHYETAQVPAASSSGPNFATYSDPTFAADFLDFTVTINGHTYTFGQFAAPAGIQSIDVIDNTDQLQFDFQRFGIGASEAITLRFISDLDFLTGTGVPMQFTFVASGVGLTPGGSFSFDLPNGDFASASFTIDTGLAAVQAVPEPGTLASLATGMLVLAVARRRERSD